MMEAQFDGLKNAPNGIYYLTPETVTALHDNLTRFRSHAENLRMEYLRMYGGGGGAPQVMNMIPGGGPMTPNSAMAAAMGMMTGAGTGAPGTPGSNASTVMMSPSIVGRNLNNSGGSGGGPLPQQQQQHQSGGVAMSPSMSASFFNDPKNSLVSSERGGWVTSPCVIQNAHNTPCSVAFRVFL